MFEQLKETLNDLEPPACPDCQVEMTWYRSTLIAMNPPAIAHLFGCPNCRSTSVLGPKQTTVHMPAIYGRALGAPTEPIPDTFLGRQHHPFIRLPHEEDGPAPSPAQVDERRSDAKDAGTGAPSLLKKEDP